MNVFILLAACFAAGFVDSVVGGGGLIQLPALMLYRGDLSIAILLGTNKFASAVGTGFAILQYRRHIRGFWKTLLRLSVVAFSAAVLGAYCVTLIPQAIIKPLILILLALVLGYTFLRKDFGRLDLPEKRHRRSFYFAALLIAFVGFYDGFLGPGTGGFFIFIFVSRLGFHFLKASASAKVLNFATNLAALVYFGWTKQIDWTMALPMAAANISGSALGTNLSNRHGVTFVRHFFVFATLGIFFVLLYKWTF